MNNTAKLGLLLPAILNPATAVIGIGFGLLWLLRDDEDETTVDPEPIKRAQPVVRTVVEPLPAVELIAAAPLAEPLETGTVTVETVSEPTPTAISEVDQSEMIRKAMSELGKRSAAARAMKRAKQDAAE